MAGIKKQSRHGYRTGTAIMVSTYRAWSTLRNRCYNPNNKSYRNYGGRGIKVCDRWMGPGAFLNFLADMGEKPSINMTLDRIDNNGNYEPCNCRWATRVEQANNTRRNRIVMITGEPVSLKESCRLMGVNYGLFSNRINRSGWSEQEALAPPLWEIKKK